MASTGNRIPNPSLSANSDGENLSPKVSLYEQSREERIKENLQRMQKLGIMDLSLKLKATSAPRRRTHKSPSSNPPTPASLPPPGPVRRSSRLKNTPPVSYSEVVLSEKGEDLKLEEGSRPEVYTDEHAKLLGSTERSWALFVDGYGKDGKRIYDPVRGKTCHQCRQKTLGYRTQCIKCNMVQGQFCGDCLYMRYGEHVLEAIENPDWVCPVCRGICNCSLCRQSKGWAPTGSLYRKISQMGFKSVAHYLIEAHRAKVSNMENLDNVDKVSAKRSLFSTDTLGNLEPSSGDWQDDNGLNREEKMNAEANSFCSLPTCAKKWLRFSDFVTGSENKEIVEESIDDDCQKRPNDTDLESKGHDGLKSENEMDLHSMDNKAPIEARPEQKHSFTLEPSSGDISGSLRQGEEISTVHDAEVKVFVEVMDVKPTDNNILTVTGFDEKEIHCTENNGKSHVAGQKMCKGVNMAAIASLDSITGRLKRKVLQIDPDGIARRLRPRNSSK